MCSGVRAATEIWLSYNGRSFSPFLFGWRRGWTATSCHLTQYIPIYFASNFLSDYFRVLGYAYPRQGYRYIP